MRYLYLCVACIAVTGLCSTAILQKHQQIIWNRTASAPPGLYWKKNGPLTRNGWAIVSSKSRSAKWAQSHGFVGKDWPLIKRVKALPGDQICRVNEVVFVNEIPIATALSHTPDGDALPNWQGCLTLCPNQAFLLNDHPRSLDGRYFGPVDLMEIEGSAILIWQRL